MPRILPITLGLALLLTVPLSRADSLAALRESIVNPPNTTNISPDLYVRHGRRKPGDPPLLAHCRQINVQVDGHTQSRRQCVTPADNF